MSAVPVDEIARRRAEILETIARSARNAGRRPEDVTLMAVTKGHGAATVANAARAGLTLFGENRVQEGSAKIAALGPEFAAIDAYFRSPNPQAMLIFVADHLRIPSDPRRMDMTDKDRYERIRETLGDHCGIVELARVDEADALRWLLAEAEKQQIKLEQDAARELEPVVH